jgi:hypothetical protein
MQPGSITIIWFINDNKIDAMKGLFKNTYEWLSNHSAIRYAMVGLAHN